VFRGVRDCVGGRLEDPDANKSYVIGVDLAKYQDYTVIVVMEKTNMQVVYFDRFHKLDWNFQKNKIANVIRRYNNAQCTIDATGIGDPIFDDLNRLGLNIIPYKISGVSKKPLIENLSLNIQEGNISYPDIPELINELNIYAYTQSQTTGHTSYSAPEGYHDDIVIALALACWNLKSEVIIDF
jgi:phage FluMu gp28-like protein